MLQQLDIVWFQFYNDESCEIGSGSFASTVQQWASDLEHQQIYLGLPASPRAAVTYSSAFSKPENLHQYLMVVRSLALPNFGGVMFWDGPLGEANRVVGDQNFISYTKELLRSTF